jgi:hypothetical protein
MEETDWKITDKKSLCSMLPHTVFPEGIPVVENMTTLGALICRIIMQSAMLP